MVVILCSVNTCFNFTCISSLKLWSILDKGSSNNNKSGLDNRDLANVALCDQSLFDGEIYLPHVLDVKI